MLSRGAVEACSCLVVVSLCFVPAYGFYVLSKNENLELQGTCGVPFPQMQNGSENLLYKLLGGNAVNDGEMPWALKLFSETFACSATLISRWHFVTAAFCLVIETHRYSNWSFVNVTPYSTYIAFGGSPCVMDAAIYIDLIGKSICVKRCRRSEKVARVLRIKSVIIPKSSYDVITTHLDLEEKLSTKGIFFSDIAIFELDEPFDANDTDLRPICTSGFPISQATAVGLRVFGFGERGADEPEVERVKQPKNMSNDDDVDEVESLCQPEHVELNSFEISAFFLHKCSENDSIECRDDYKGYFEGSRRQTFLNRSLCYGDSGGGMVATVNERSHLIGVASGSRLQCDPRSPNFKPYNETFTRLDIHSAFICRYTGICPLAYEVNISDAEDAVVFPEGNPVRDPKGSRSPMPRRRRPTSEPDSAGQLDEYYDYLDADDDSPSGRRRKAKSAPATGGRLTGAVRAARFLVSVLLPLSGFLQ